MCLELVLDATYVLSFETKTDVLRNLCHFSNQNTDKEYMSVMIGYNAH